jgi:hypothetical protein
MLQKLRIPAEDIMFKSIGLGAALALCAATICNAAGMPAPVDSGASAIVRVAEGCGDNRWRDTCGQCHWFHNGFGTERGTDEACPTWAHWYAGRCVHN